MTSKSTDHDEKRSRAKCSARTLVSLAAKSVDQVVVSEAAMRQIEDAAIAVCYGRASVPRDSSFQREINGIPEMEEPPRVAKQLHMLMVCLVAIGLTDDEAVAIVSRVAIDSMPATRARTLEAIASASGPMTSAEIARKVGINWKVADRALDDFEALGLIHRSEANEWDQATKGAAQRKPWIIDHEEMDVIRAVFQRRREAWL